MSNPSEYDRVIYWLNGLSNLASQHPGISDEDLMKLIAQSLTGPLADWEICWGPHVVQAPNGKAVNTMYAVKKRGEESYVIGIAGTNATSFFDWIWEDAFVSLQVPWIYAPLTDAKIAAGTAIGLVILQSMRPDEGVPAAGMTLWSFLETLTDKPISVTVAGHSLGGVLAPTLALWLRDTQGIPGLWDPRQNATVTTMPFAGPTAGNEHFAAHSNAKLPNATLPSSSPASFRYANSLDIVPHAWNEDTLEALKTLYAPDIPENKIIDSLVELAKSAAGAGDYTQLTPPDPPWTGTINKTLIKPVEPPLEELESFFNYLWQAVYQHTQAYNEHFAPETEQMMMPAASQISVPPIVHQLVEKAGGTLPPEVVVSTEPLIQQMLELALGPGVADQSQQGALVAKMKRFAAKE